MYQPILTLPLYDEFKGVKLIDRWRSAKGLRDKDKIIQLIKNGAGEDFIQYALSDLEMITEDGDLAGIELWQLTVTFPHNDSFEQIIDFSYSKWWHSKFTDGLFGCTLRFARVYNCEFNNCTFHFFDAYGSIFENCKFINCDFIEHSRFNNCELINCTFDSCFMDDRIFIDSLLSHETTFDLSVGIIEINNHHRSSINLPKEKLSELFKGIKEGYLSGQEYRKYRQYYYQQKHSEMLSTENLISKISYIIQDLVVGYGVKPMRTVTISILTIIIFWLLFCTTSSITHPMITSAGAFLTVGEIPQTRPYSYIFLIEGLLGLMLASLFITTLANIWFQEK